MHTRYIAGRLRATCRADDSAGYNEIKRAACQGLLAAYANPAKVDGVCSFRGRWSMQVVICADELEFKNAWQAKVGKVAHTLLLKQGLPEPHATRWFRLPTTAVHLLAVNTGALFSTLWANSKHFVHVCTCHISEASCLVVMARAMCTCMNLLRDDLTCFSSRLITQTQICPGAGTTRPNKAHTCYTSACRMYQEPQRSEQPMTG